MLVDIGDGFRRASLPLWAGLGEQEQGGQARPRPGALLLLRPPASAPSARRPSGAPHFALRSAPDVREGACVPRPRARARWHCARRQARVGPLVPSPLPVTVAPSCRILSATVRATVPAPVQPILRCASPRPPLRSCLVRVRAFAEPPSNQVSFSQLHADVHARPVRCLAAARPSTLTFAMVLEIGE
jgi:hypothetical protein